MDLIEKKFDDVGFELKTKTNNIIVYTGLNTTIKFLFGTHKVKVISNYDVMHEPQLILAIEAQLSELGWTENANDSAAALQFKRLGYHRRETQGTDPYICYEEIEGKRVEFYIRDKMFNMTYDFEEKGYNYESFTVETIYAIEKQLRELGWI